MIFYRWDLRNTDYHKIEGYAPKLQLLAERLVMDGPRLGFLTSITDEWKEYLEACGYIFIDLPVRLHADRDEQGGKERGK